MRNELTGAMSVNTSLRKYCNLRYVLVTPARNEEAFIELTIKSVVGQTVLPVKWVIVSDGSTDGTDAIVEKYSAENQWIELVKMPPHKGRHFAAKVHAFNAGYARVKNIDYDIIGNLDADISFGPDYFEFLLDNIARIPSLGVAGTAFVEDSSIAYNYKYTNIEHVSGQCQLFRSECFEEIGGYTPIKGGGIDWTAVTTARLKGWQTRTFTEKTFIHHRRMGTGTGTLLASRFTFGKQDYYLGAHPIWEVLRCLYQMKKKPFILGGLFLLFGYLWAFLIRVAKPIPKKLIEFRRDEQMRRLKKIFKIPFYQRKGL
jgi:biofilm PGA synthesis N-glycosyltransferase PgaC